MKYIEIQQWLDKKARETANQWFVLQTNNIFESYYLYFKPGELLVSPETPKGFELATGERIKPNQTIEQCQAWIFKVAWKLPILPQEM